MFESGEDLKAYIQELKNTGQLSQREFDKVMGRLFEQGLFFRGQLKAIYVDTIKGMMPDEAAFDAYQQTVLNILTGVYNAAESQISQLTSEGVNRTADVFQINADAYRDALTEIEALDVSPEVRQQTITFLGETMNDEAILYDLIYNKEIDVTLLAKMSIDLNMTEIDEMFKKFRTLLQNAARTGDQGVIDGLMDRFGIEGILGNLFDNTASGVRSGFTKLNSMLRELVSSGRMTLEQASQFVIELSNSIKTLSTDQVASLLKDQMELSKKLFTLPEQISKGDFTNFAELVEIYGIEGTRAIFSGNTKVLTQFFDAQNKKVTDQIKESIALIEKTTESRKIFGTLTPEQIKANERQLEALGLMLQYYETLATAEQLRNYRLGEAKDILKEMNDLLSLQEKLLNLGINAPFLQTIEEMVNSYYTSGIGFLTTQLTADLDMLESLQDDNGFFDPDKDTYGMVEASIEKAMETFTQLIDAVTAAYNTQKKAVEERYKAEITAIKDSHSDRWSQIDFTNKLAEAEEKIVEARRALMGFAISGVSRGTLEQAQKDLKKLQEERQKIIEQQMIDEATEELDRQMQDELIEVQRSLTTVLGDLILEMEGLSDVFTLTTDPNYIPGVTPVLPGLTGLGTDPAQTAVDNLTDSNNGLIAVNTTLIDAILALTNRLRNDKTTNTGGGGGGRVEELMVADNTPFAGIGRI
jgi:polyhydroxyalkanoate synthesis regulator phasin